MTYKVIMYIMAFGVVIGGVDRILGNRFGLGEKFQEGIMYMGPTALSIVGIICLEPLLVAYISPVLVPFFAWIKVDPAMFGSILALDMGGYHMAMDLAQNPLIGLFAGIIVASVLGCTLTFYIPLGMEMLEDNDKKHFSNGIMLGLIAMPIVLISGGLICGLGFAEIFKQSWPVFILVVFIIIGLLKIPKGMTYGFGIFAAVIKILATIGLILSAVTYMTGLKVLPIMAPIEDAMKVVYGIGIILLGSLPVAELLQRVLKKHLESLGKYTGLNSTSIMGLMMTSMVTAIATFALMKDMDVKGKVVNAAFMVCATGLTGSCMAFVVSVAPEALFSFLISRLLGGIVAIAIVLILMRCKATG